MNAPFYIMPNGNFPMQDAKPVGVQFDEYLRCCEPSECLKLSFAEFRNALSMQFSTAYTSPVICPTLQVIRDYLEGQFYAWSGADPYSLQWVNHIDNPTFPFVVDGDGDEGLEVLTKARWENIAGIDTDNWQNGDEIRGLNSIKWMVNRERNKSGLWFGGSGWQGLSGKSVTVNTRRSATREQHNLDVETAWDAAESTAGGSNGPRAYWSTYTTTANWISTVHRNCARPVIYLTDATYSGFFDRKLPTFSERSIDLYLYFVCAIPPRGEYAEPSDNDDALPVTVTSNIQYANMLNSPLGKSSVELSGDIIGDTNLSLPEPPEGDIGKGVGRGYGSGGGEMILKFDFTECVP